MFFHAVIGCASMTWLPLIQAEGLSFAVTKSIADSGFSGRSAVARKPYKPGVGLLPVFSVALQIHSAPDSRTSLCSTVSAAIHWAFQSDGSASPVSHH